jgi:hypothetical protein
VTKDGLTKRDVAITAAGIIIAAVFVAVLSWFLVEVFAGPDPRDPLTKAGGLKPTQAIRKVN